MPREKIISMDDQQAASLFLAKIGHQIRSARAGKKMTRKELALASGTSERYLAQIESGNGNLSVLVLRQLAAALDSPLGQLVEDDQFEPELLKILEMVQQQSAAQRAAFCELFRNWFDSSIGKTKHRRVALTGLRGAGKSTLGAMVGAQLDWPVVELTKEIETVSGLTTSEIFSLYGDQGYHELENQCLRKVIASYDQVILSVAGGITAEPDTFEMLLGNFHTVWLKASAEEHMMRVLQQGDKRPIKGFPKAMTALRNILATRENQYARADMELDTSGKSVSACAEQLVSMIERNEISGYDR